MAILYEKKPQNFEQKIFTRIFWKLKMKLLTQIF